MIYNLNNLLHHNMNKIISTDNITNDKYPKQNIEKLGKIIQLAFNSEDDPNCTFEARYYLDGNKWRHNPQCPWFMIVRYDIEYPYRTIGISHTGKVIVTDSREVDNLYAPPDNVDRKPIDLPLQVKDKEIIVEKNQALNNRAFELLQRKEIVHNYPAQAEFIGMPVYTEYAPDILSLKRDEVYINEEYHEAPDEQIRRELSAINVAFAGYPINILKGFHLYYNRFIKEKTNNPRRAVNLGMVIRNDLGGNDGCIVVMEYRKNGICFICNEDANIYYDSDYNYNNLGTQPIFWIINNQKIYNTNITLKTI